MGYYVYMDENGDAEGNYSLVSLCDVNSWRRDNGQQSDDIFERSAKGGCTITYPYSFTIVYFRFYNMKI